MKSFSYYLTLLVIRIKGIKNEFKKDPIDYLKLRKADLHSPPPRALKDLRNRSIFIKETEITELEPTGSADKLIIFCHGGAFVYGPVDYHWVSAIKMARATRSLVWVPDYPKAPETNIVGISLNLHAVYKEAITRYPLKKVILVGDSVGGTLITTLVQHFVKSKKSLPSLLVLISPVMDASFSNAEIEKIESHDPILSKNGCLSAKSMAAGKLDLKNPLISPLFGSFARFPKTLLFIAEYDITRPDQELAVKKMKQENVDLQVCFGKEMPHIWPVLPVMKEARIDFKKIISAIKNVEKRNPA